MPSVQDYIDAFLPVAKKGLPVLCICPVSYTHLWGLTAVQVYGDVHIQRKKEKENGIYTPVSYTHLFGLHILRNIGSWQIIIIRTIKLGYQRKIWRSWGN